MDVIEAAGTRLRSFTLDVLSWFRRREVPHPLPGDLLMVAVFTDPAAKVTAPGWTLMQTDPHVFWKLAEVSERPLTLTAPEPVSWHVYGAFAQPDGET